MTIAVREQSRESSYFEALLEPPGGAYFQLKHHAYLCTIFNIQYIQYQYQYGLILILNIDKSTEPNNADIWRSREGGNGRAETILTNVKGIGNRVHHLVPNICDKNQLE